MHLGILHQALVVACNRTQLSMSNDEKFNEAMVEMIRPTHNTGCYCYILVQQCYKVSLFDIEAIKMSTTGYHSKACL